MRGGVCIKRPGVLIAPLVVAGMLRVEAARRNLEEEEGSMRHVFRGPVHHQRGPIARRPERRHGLRTLRSWIVRSWRGVGSDGLLGNGDQLHDVLHPGVESHLALVAGGASRSPSVARRACCGHPG